MIARWVRRGPERPLAALTGGIAFAIYSRTLLPGIAFGDWGEMQTVPHVLGVAHPTGYPTYVLLGWIAQLVPLGSVAFRANLLSALLVAASLATLVLILARLSVPAPIAAVAALAVGPVGTVWAAATVAEVNPLHLLLVALTLHRALVWADERRLRDLILGGLLIGLALGNHLLTVFTVPFIAAFVVWAGRASLAARPWALALPVLGGAVGLSTYALIPIAASQSPPLPYNHPVTFDAWWWLVTGVQFRSQFDFLSSAGPQALADSLPTLWALVAGRATPVLPIVGAIGLLGLIRRRPAVGLTLAGILFVHVYVWANYLHLEHYLLVPWLLLGVGAGVGLGELARLVGARPDAWRSGSDAAGGDSRRSALLAAGLAGLVFALGLTAANWSGADRSGERGGDAYVAAVMDGLPADSAIMTPWDASTPLWHARFVLGARPDILVVDDTNIVYDGWGTRERRIAALVCERPVFILRLHEAELEPTRAAYRLEPFLTVRVAQGGPLASLERPIYRIVPPASCDAPPAARTS